jgi:hypothetical protein
MQTHVTTFPHALLPKNGFHEKRSLCLQLTICTAVCQPS